jgi:phage terminase large subunit-like protein
VVLAAAWEDDDTVIAVVNQGGEQAVLRLESDGTATRVSDVREEQMSTEFFLPQHLFGQ